MAREHELLAHSSWLQVRRHCEAPFLQQLRGGPAAAHDGHSMRFQVRPPTADRQELMPCTFLPVLSALLGTKKKETKAVCIALADPPPAAAACCQLPYSILSPNSTDWRPPPPEPRALNGKSPIEVLVPDTSRGRGGRAGRKFGLSSTRHLERQNAQDGLAMTRRR
jgi:hypothetical protein